MKDFKKIITFALLLIFASSMHGLTDGELDVSFNSTGLSALLDADSNLNAVAIQADGKIIAVGSTDIQGKHSFLISRFNTNGALDKTFGQNGKVITRFGVGESYSCANGVAIQDDGKIIAVGVTNTIKNTNRWCLARYNVDGSPDESFFGGSAIFKGTVITFFGNDSLSRANAVALTSDNKIVVAGTSQIGSNKKYFSIAQYAPDGSLDEKEFNPKGNGAPAGTVRTSFGDAYDDEAFAVVVQPNGRIIAGGSSKVTGVKTFAMARYTIDGSLDNSFFSPGFALHNGTVVTPFACGETQGAIKALLIQPDGKIIAGGATNSNSHRKDVSHFALARYDVRGMLDESFGGYGIATMPGTVITSFGAQEIMSEIKALVLQGDGKIIAGGRVSINGISNFALARYINNGAIDCNFNDGFACAGEVITSIGGKKIDGIAGLAIQSNGDIVAAGTTDVHGRPQGIVARYLSQDILQEPTILYPAHNSVIVNGSNVKIRGVSQNPGIIKIFVDENLVSSCVSRGTSNSWNSQLPPLASGNHSIQVLEIYPGGNVSLISPIINLVIDQHPKAVNKIISTCGLNSVSGDLDATGASGHYSFELGSAHNGSVALNGNEFNFTPSIPVGLGSFDFFATDLLTKCKGKGTINVIINEVPAAVVGSFNVCQDTTFTGSVAQYVNAGNAPFNFAQVGQGVNGAALVNKDGTFSFNPNSGFSGVASFQYQVTDAKGCVSDPVSVNITVAQAPSAQNATFTTHEAQVLSNSLAKLVTGGTPPYTFNIVSCPNNCAITLQPNGSFVVIPRRGFSGTLAYTYQVTDANQCMSNIGNITVTVFESPVASNGQFAVCQNRQLSESLNNLVAKGTSPYLFEQVGLALNGTATINKDGSFTFIPNNDFVGQTKFTYKVIDQNNSVSNGASVIITVNPLPVAGNADFATCQETLLAGSLAASASNGSKPYTFALVDSATNGSLTVNSDGSFEFIPDQGFNGTSTFSYSVTDSNGCTSLPGQATITVWENPTAQDSSAQTCENKSVSGSLSALISGGLQPYAFVTDQVENGAVIINQDGSYTFTSSQNFVGTASFAYHVNDAHQCNSNSGTIIITVNPSPTVQPSSISTLENAPVSGNLASLASGGIPPYTFNSIGQPANGDVVLNNDGSYQFIPSADYFGQASFVYQVIDSDECISNSAQVTVNVFELPKVEDSQIADLVNTPQSGSLADFILAGTSPFMYQVVSNPIHGTLVVNNDGSYTYTPNSDFTGNDSFQFMVTDAHNGTSNIATISFAMYAPLEIGQATYVLCEDAPLNGNLNTYVSGSVTPYVFSLITQAQNGLVSIDADGSFSYTPNAGFVGADTFSYQVVDSLGLSKVVGSVDITIFAKPVAQGKIFTIFENQALLGSLAALASGGKSPYNFAQVNTSTNGSLALNVDGTFVFTPTEGFAGIASFIYTISDLNNCASNPATITIAILQLPTVSNGNVSGILNKVITGTVVPLINGGSAPYEFQVVSNPSHGSLVLNNDGSYSYAPNENYSGIDNFEYSVVDANKGQSNTGIITITVYKPVSVTEQKQYTSCSNSPISGSVSDSVINGQQPYTFTIAQQVQHGNLQLNSDGSFEYMPANGFNGTDSFEFNVQDALGDSATGNVLITVFEGPLAQDKTLIIKNSNLNGSLVGLVSSGMAPYQFAQVGAASNGSVVVNADGTFTFESTIEGVSVANFAYQVTDANNCMSNIASITINCNPPPIVRASTFTTPQDQPLSSSLVPSVIGGSAPYIFIQVGQATNGTLVLSRNGSFIFTPHSGFIGTASFDFIANDNTGCSSAISTVNITVNEDANKRLKNLPNAVLNRLIRKK